MRFAARVEVRLLPGIADPEGATIERALPALGFDDVDRVRAGRSFDFEVEAADEDAARMWAGKIAEACGWPQEVRPFKPRMDARS